MNRAHRLNDDGEFQSDDEILNKIRADFNDIGNNQFVDNGYENVTDIQKVQYF